VDTRAEPLAEAVLESRLEQVSPAFAEGAQHTRRLVDAVHDDALAGQGDREGQADVAQPDDAYRVQSRSPSATSRLARWTSPSRPTSSQ